MTILVAGTAEWVKSRSTVDELNRTRAEVRDLREEMRMRVERSEVRIEEEPLLSQPPE